MIQKIRKHLVMVVAVIAALSLLAIWCWFFIAVRNNDLHMQTMFGHLDTTDEITIRGLLADTRQKSAFTLQIRDGKCTVRQSFSASSADFLASLSQPSTSIQKSNYFLPTEDAVIEDASEEAARAGYTLLRVDSARLHYALHGPESDFLFATDVVYSSKDLPIELEFAPQKDPETLFPTPYGHFEDLHTGEEDSQPYLIRKAGERTYIFTRTGADCSGFGGMYDITEALESAAGKQPIFPRDNRYYQIELPNLAPIDLENGNVQIFGMEVVGERLVFLLLDNGEIALRWFDPQAEAFVGETVLDIPVNTEGLDNQHPCYRFTAGEDDLGILEIPGIYDGAARLSSYFLLNGKDCTIDTVCTDSKGYIAWRSALVIWKNGRLYTLKSVPTQYPNGIYDTHLLFSIYEDGRLIYSGAVVSGASDDARYAQQPANVKLDLPIRQFYDLSLE